MYIVDFNLRIPVELNNKLIKIAKEQDRSKNKQIEQILKEYVRTYEKDNRTIYINK